MNTLTKKIANYASALMVCLFSIGISANTNAHNPFPPSDDKHIIMPQPITQPKIQLAILLDTSGSMDGLIDQTRNQLWQVINEFTNAKQRGVTPILEVALFEYGNDGNSKDTGFVRMLNNFTRELDEVSEGLFSLTTNGGSEYCGFAIKTAVKSLNWSRSDRDIKTIFIAGNEPFTQGPVNYIESLKLAKRKGIAVNTIHAGNHQVGIDTGWEHGARWANGDYMSIDANKRTVHIASPHDKKIALLNQQLNGTYIPYGVTGSRKAKRQMEQDEANESVSPALLAKRAQTKSSSYYNNAQWDLVDAIKDGKVKGNQLAEMANDVLPEEMRKMDEGQKIQYVQNKIEERQLIKREIIKLTKARKEYVLKKRKETAKRSPVMSDALTAAIKKQAKTKAFEFSESN